MMGCVYFIKKKLCNTYNMEHITVYFAIKINTFLYNDGSTGSHNQTSTGPTQVPYWP